MANANTWRVAAKRFPFAIHNDESGQSMLLLSFSLVIFVAMMGLVLDIGYGIAIQRQMQFAADAAAIAGAHDLAEGNSASVATARMEDLLDANNADPEASTFTVIGNSTTDVWARTTVPTLFLGLFNINELSLAAHARAAAGQITGTGNLMPFIVQKDAWAAGQSVVLWADKNGPGNFGWVRWQGQGTSTTVLRHNLDYPAQSDVVNIGDAVNGLTGVSFTPVQDNLNAWMGKTVTVILYDPAETVNSGSGLQYTARGFAHFVITGVYPQGSASEIHGTFVSYVTFGQSINPGVNMGIQGVGMLQ